VTPKGSVTKEQTTEISARGELGMFDVFPGHMPFLTKLDPGVLTLGSGTKQVIYAVGAGVMEIHDQGVVRVLVERAIAKQDINLEAARAEVDATDPLLREWKKPLDGEYRSLKSRRDWAHAQVDACDAAR